jgi:hypothetical protein
MIIKNGSITIDPSGLLLSTTFNFSNIQVNLKELQNIETFPAETMNTEMFTT